MLIDYNGTEYKVESSHEEHDECDVYEYDVYDGTTDEIVAVVRETDTDFTSVQSGDGKTFLFFDPDYPRTVSELVTKGLDELFEYVKTLESLSK